MSKRRLLGKNQIPRKEENREAIQVSALGWEAKHKFAIDLSFDSAIDAR